MNNRLLTCEACGSTADDVDERECSACGEWYVYCDSCELNEPCPYCRAEPADEKEVPR